MVIQDFCPAARYIDNGGDRCLVWFGGIHEPNLNFSFLPSGWNALNLLDLRADWYTLGIEGFADSFEQAVDRVRSITQGQRVVCGGQSSGGYAALRFAHALPANLCIAFAPQTKNIIHSNGVMMPMIEVPSVEEVYMVNSPAFPVLLHVSRSETESIAHAFWDDWRQIAQIRTLDRVTTTGHPYDAHAVTVKLAAEGRFYSTLLSGMSLYL